MWGKWAQNENKIHTNAVSSEKELYDLLTRPVIEVQSLIFPNDEVACVCWEYSEENMATGKNVNVAVAAYVTTQARLKLYEYLGELGESVLYCDTASVIYIQNVDEAPKVHRGIIWATSQMSWRSLALAPSLRSLHRVALKTMQLWSFALPHENAHLNVK